MLRLICKVLYLRKPEDFAFMGASLCATLLIGFLVSMTVKPAENHQFSVKAFQSSHK